MLEKILNIIQDILPNGLPIIGPIIGPLGSLLARRITKSAIDHILKEVKKRVIGDPEIPVQIIKDHTFPQDYTGPVLVKIKNLQEKSEILIWWGRWIKKDELIPQQEQYILFEKRNKDGWPLTVFLEKEASIEFIHHVINDDNWSYTKDFPVFHIPASLRRVLNTIFFRNS